MANIKLELDEYLNKNQKNKPSNGHHVHIPKAFKKLLGNEPGEQTETLLDSTQKTYFNFPSLVSRTHIVETLYNEKLLIT